MFAVKVNIKGVAEIISTIPAVRDFASEDFIQRATIYLLTRAKKYVNVDTGRLRADLHMVTNLRGIASTGVVATDLPYAKGLEEGTEPHRPNRDAIQRWVERKGIHNNFFSTKNRNNENRLRLATWIISRSIEKHGTKPHPFMAPAKEDLEETIGQRLVDSFNRAKERYKFR